MIDYKIVNGNKIEFDDYLFENLGEFLEYKNGKEVLKILLKSQQKKLI